MTAVRALLLAVAGLAAVAAPGATDGAWQPTRWLGEEALVSSHDGWTAVVSIERARLVSFGRGAGNLLFSSATRDDPAGWGGHRLWLGPQVKWAKIWPPPDAWEHRRPERTEIKDGELRLVLADAGDGWPRLTRTYRWGEHGLVCGAELHGGSRPAQVIEIIQIPAKSTVTVLAPPEPAAPLGYAVFSPAGLQPASTGSAPPQLERHGPRLTLRHVGIAAKFGFRPQALPGTTPAGPILVRRDALRGPTVGDPDQGYSTQVFVGGREPFIELEQLSPLFAPGADAAFAIEIEGPEGNRPPSSPGTAAENPPAR